MFEKPSTKYVDEYNRIAKKLGEENFNPHKEDEEDIPQSLNDILGEIIIKLQIQKEFDFKDDKGICKGISVAQDFIREYIKEDEEENENV